MNKLAILSLLVICIALAAGQRVGRRGRNGGSGRKGGNVRLLQEVETVARDGSTQFVQESVNLQQIIENAESEASDRKGGKKGRKNGGDIASVRVEEQVFFPTTEIIPFAGRGLSRRGNVARNAQRVIDSENQAAAAEGAVAQSSLQAGDRNLDALQALLQQKQARQERIDARAERKERRKDAAKFASGDRLTAENELDYETFENAEEFNDLNVAASLDIQDAFGVEIQSANSLKEDAAVSESSGSQFSFGTSLKTSESVDAETTLEEEVLFEDEFANDEELSAAAAEEDAINAREELRVENAAFIDSQDFRQAGRGFQESRDFFDGVGSRSPFGNFF